MPEMVSFHVLERKFLEEEKDIPTPEAAQQVLYYALAIGHHVGVIDCLKKSFECTLETYKAWIDFLPAGEAQRKMAGLLTFGEIYIEKSHVSLLASVFSPLKEHVQDPFKTLTIELLEVLAAMVQEPARYLMIKLPRKMA